MAVKRDLYEVLGIGRDASESDIKRAFRKLARDTHPDLHPGDKAAEERFKEVNAAYEVLSDPEKRQQYDTYGPDGPQGGMGMGGFGEAFGGFGDIFDAFFGGGRRSTGPAPGADLQYRLEITLEEAAFGVEKQIPIERIEACEACHGRGSATPEGVKACPTCHGAGQVRQVQNTLLGQMSTVIPCPQCHGQGNIVTDPCPQCHGEGRVHRNRELTVRVPPGVDTGTQIRLSGQGEAGQRGGATGDLYVVTMVRDHPVFRREGLTILCEVPISFTQAALGTELEVPTLYGPYTLNIPEGTQTNATFRIRERGMPALNGRRVGDQVVQVRVCTPTQLTDKQKELLRAFAADGGEKHSEHKSFFERLKKVLKN